MTACLAPLALVHVSGLTGAAPAPELSRVATGGFPVGGFASGYGTGRRTGY